MTRAESTVHWLHLSDFHFDAGKSWDRDRSVKALLEYLGERKKDGWRPDLVFATGDFANRGKREEFDQAILFFRKLAEVLDLDLARDLFLVPGNHDVDRGAKGPLDDAMLGALAGKHGAQQQEEIAKVLRHAPTMRLLGSRLAEYYSFTERLLGSARRAEADRPWRTDVREIRGVEVAVLQLNSAWACGKEKEKGDLLVGAHQVEEALSQSGSARLRFLLVHHPADYLADGDASFFRELAQDRTAAHFLLRGHLHENDLQLRVNPDGGLVELAAGAAHQGTGLPKRFLIGSFDLGKGAGMVELLTFSDKGRGFWTVDSTSYRGRQDGRFNFELPSAKDGSQGKAAGRKQSRNSIVTARYRAAAAAVHGQMRFIGFPAVAAGQKPNVGVQDLFVPLKLALGHPQSSDVLTTAALLDRLQPGQDPPGRFVVLGEPGSGKTTLCRFAAVFFAGELVLSEVELRGQPLPLFLPFRDYLHRRREIGDCSLLDYLAEEAKNHLQVAGAGLELLKKALEEKGAVLLLDGLDEVGNAQERVEMRDRVSAFCRQYPRLPVLITSRFAGYGDAPISEKAFLHLELKSFADEELHAFVANWYAVQEPKDPRARGRGIADLLAAFAAEPRVRVLASNPLLATLIALVHRTEAKLPGERAKLYELVVRTLLETWPALGHREFHEIDHGLQRTFLEDFAFAQQKKRSFVTAEVAFERQELVTSLALLIGRQRGESQPDNARRTAEAWVDYLAAGTGLIVEQQPGVFVFLHLSLLEYLAACALDRGDEALDKLINRSNEQPAWREVLLLAVGRHATDSFLLERIFAGLASEARWEFLLLCLREEAAFGEVIRCRILDAAAKKLLSIDTYEWASWWEVARTLERFSARHGHAIREWRREKLGRARGEELRAAVAWSLGESKDICRILDQRQDRTTAAADLLEYWPGSEPGEWAAGQVEPAAANAVLAAGPAELAVVRALAANWGAGLRLAAAAIPLQLQQTAHFCHMAAAAADRLAGQERRSNRGLPCLIHTRPFPLTLYVHPNWPRLSCNFDPVQIPCLVQVFPLNFALKFTLEFARGFARDFARNLTRDLAQYFARVFALNFIPDFTRGFALNFVRDFIRSVAKDFAQEFVRDFFQDFARDAVRDFALNFDLDFDERARTSRKAPARNADLVRQGPSDPSVAEDRRSLAAFFEKPERKTHETALRGILHRRVAEAWIALTTTTTTEASRETAAAYLGYRLQNVALLYLWPALDLHLPAAPSTEQLALYLQLGWTQSTTTHEWPATERWIALMKAGPPDHWLPRAQWHLCWLLHDPTVATHQTAFNKALREGLGDADPGRLAVAQTLEKVIGFYP